MKHRLRPLAATLLALFSAASWAQTSSMLGDVVVTSTRPKAMPEASNIGASSLAPLRAATSDTASLLTALPGVHLQSAGGVSGLPTMQGLADDRLRIRVDGMDLISACANHMNPPLSYINPTNVEQIKVYAGLSPVSAGGDSIGGAILVNAKAPVFAAPGQGMLTGGELGGFYRSNGDAFGVNAVATLATENFSLRYAGSTAQSDNYKSAKAFKPGLQATYTTAGSHWIPGDEVASTAYKTENHQLGLAYRLDNHLLDLKLGYQHIPYQGFPNQHMDMTDNRSTQVNLGYTGRYGWGRLEARVYHEETRHKMDFGEDKLYWYGMSRNVAGMPMETEGRNTGALLKAEIGLSERDLLRVGGELQRYRLSDWWSPVANSMMMGPNTFWNINDGQRDRAELFGEWEATWSAQWLTLVGVRAGTVTMDAGDVQAYDSRNPIPSMGSGMGMANPDAPAAAAFNARNRQRTDDNIDLTLLARYTPDATQTYEGGYARKTRSPSLYERYTWGVGGMAMTMNNWVNDGNGYVGNPDLKPEVAHKLSVSADWHDPTGSLWSLRVTPYYTLVDDYIDARCLTTCTPGRYNYLTLANDDARLVGVDVAGFAALGRIDGVGSFATRGALGYVRGKNRTTGDHLYNMMPLNARLALEHRLGSWTNTVEGQAVAGKEEVSEVRGEVKTPGYGLLHLRSSYEWKNVRIDLGIENALDRQYALPLGGAYIGQGATMSLGSTTAWTATGQPPYGYVVPGMGRSFYLGLNYKF